MKEIISQIDNIQEPAKKPLLTKKEFIHGAFLGAPISAGLGAITAGLALTDNAWSVISQNFLHGNKDQYGYKTDMLSNGTTTTDPIFHHFTNLFGFNNINFGPVHAGASLDVIKPDGSVVNVSQSSVDIANFPWPAGHAELPILTQYLIEGGLILAGIGTLLLLGKGVQEGIKFIRNRSKQSHNPEDPSNDRITGKLRRAKKVVELPLPNTSTQQTA